MHDPHVRVACGNRICEVARTIGRRVIDDQQIGFRRCLTHQADE